MDEWPRERILRTANRQRRRINDSRIRGFTLIEFITASAILTTGMLGLAMLLATGIQSNSLGGNTNVALSLAQSKIEDLRNLSSSSAARADGGSLTSSVANYYDSPGIFIRRWELTAGPAGSQICKVRVLPANTQNTTTKKTVELSTVIR
jgi:prepilin-type N-terminal cleavage/methylation domain-containing protein